MAAAAALSHPFFLAAAAAASSSSNAAAAAAAAASVRDVNETSSNSSSTSIIPPRLSSLDDHFHLTSSSTLKRSLSPSFLSKTIDDNNKRFASAMTNNASSFTPPATNSPSLLSQVSKLKIITKGKSCLFMRFDCLINLFVLENNCEQQINEKSINLSFELNGIAYQGTLYATNNTGSKD